MLVCWNWCLRCSNVATWTKLFLSLYTYTYCVCQWLVGEGPLLDTQCGECVAGMWLVGTDFEMDGLRTQDRQIEMAQFHTHWFYVWFFWYLRLRMWDYEPLNDRVVSKHLVNYEGCGCIHGQMWDSMNLISFILCTVSVIVEIYQHVHITKIKSHSEE